MFDLLIQKATENNNFPLVESLRTTKSQILSAYLESYTLDDGLGKAQEKINTNFAYNRSVWEWLGDSIAEIFEKIRSSLSSTKEELVEVEEVQLDSLKTHQQGKHITHMFKSEVGSKRPQVEDQENRSSFSNMSSTD
ncbi:MAG: hypothetical protein ACRCXC_05235 [Legionella sp.]